MDTSDQVLAAWQHCWHSPRPADIRCCWCDRRYGRDLLGRKPGRCDARTDAGHGPVWGHAAQVVFDA